MIFKTSNVAAGISFIGLAQILPQIYPTHNWILSNFEQFLNVNKSQWALTQQLQRLFIQFLGRVPSDMEINYKHPAMKFSESQFALELDIYIPSLKLAFEVNIYAYPLLP